MRGRETVSSSKQNRWARRASQAFGLPGLLAIIPFVLLAAHYTGGATQNSSYLATIFSLIIIIIGLTSFTLSKFRAATPGLAVIAGVAMVWALLGMSGDRLLSHYEISSLATAGAAFLLGRTAGMRSETHHYLWRALIWSFLMFGILALVGHIANYVSDPMSAGAYDATRLRAGFPSPNSAAALLAIMAMICAGRMLYAANHAGSGVQTRHQLVDYIFGTSMLTFFVFMLAMSCLWLTASWSVICLTLLALFLLLEAEFKTYRGGRIQMRKRHKLIRIGIIVGLSAAAIGLMFNDLLSDRTEELASTLPTKLDIFGVYSATWLEKPWFGHGMGSFEHLHDQLVNPGNVATIGTYAAAHNVVLQWLIEQGVVGTILIIAVFFALHIPIVRAIQKKTPRSKTILRVSLCVSALVILHNMLDYSLEIPSIVWTYALLLGLAHGRSSVLLGYRHDVKKTEQTAEATKPDLAVA